MGLLGKLFGNKGGNKIPDGLWLKGEREGDWIEIAYFESGQSIEYNDYSCYTDNGGTYVILRSTYEEERRICYMGAWILPDHDDLILIVCDRTESLDGSCVAPDDWSKNRIIQAQNVDGLGDLIGRARRLAAARNYTNPPAYVYMLKMGLAAA
jgi:hypothetical protein